MNRKKIAIFAAVAVLAVGTVFGSGRLRKTNMNVYYKTSLGVCTGPVSCSLTTGTAPFCVAGITSYWSTAGCPGTADLSNLKPPTN